MRIGTIEEFLKEYDATSKPEDYLTVRPEFPHVVIVECDYPEMDVAIRWCWQRFGPRDGQCLHQPDAAACPLILATERIEEMEMRGKNYQVKRYSAVAEHSHEGTWTTNWLGKTDYDHGFCEFCFSSEADKKRFVEFVPSVDWGENFPWLKDGTW